MGASLILNITVEGNKDKVSSCITAVAGFGTINEVIPDGSDQNTNTYKVTIENDEMRKTIVSELVKNNFSISEVSSDRPSLEEVFVELTANAPKKKGLMDLLDDMETESQNNDKEEN